MAGPLRPKVKIPFWREITAAHIRWVQDHHILGCIKHFALNDQETGRTLANAIVDERSARESDLLAFELGIKDSNVQSVMCSHNLIHCGILGAGEYSSARGRFSSS